MTDPDEVFESQIVSNLVNGFLNEGPNPRLHREVIRNLPRKLVFLLQRLVNPLYSTKTKLEILESLETLWNGYGKNTRKEISSMAPIIAKGLDGLNEIDFSNQLQAYNKHEKES